MIDIDDLKRQQQQTKDNADYKEDIIEETIKTIKQIVAVSIYPKLQDQAFSDKISFELKERLRKKSNAMLELSFNIIPDKTMLDYAKKISIDKLLTEFFFFLALYFFPVRCLFPLSSMTMLLRRFFSDCTASNVSFEITASTPFVIQNCSWSAAPLLLLRTLYG